MRVAPRGPNALLQALVPLARRIVPVVLATAAGCSGGDGGTSPNPTPAGTIAVNLTPSSLTIAPGGVGGVGVSITRGGGFDGPVTLTASGVPAGVSLTFGSATVSAVAVSTSVNLTVAASAPVGTAEISIVGRSGDIVSPASKLTLRIQ